MKTKELTYYDSREAQQFKAQAELWIERLNEWKEFAEAQTGLAITLRDVFNQANFKARLMELANQDASRQQLPANRQRVLNDAEQLYHNIYQELAACWEGELNGVKFKPLFDNKLVDFSQQDGFSLKNLDDYLKERFTYAAGATALQLYQAVEKLRNAAQDLNDTLKYHFLQGGVNGKDLNITVNGSKVVFDDLNINTEYFCRTDLDALSKKRQADIKAQQQAAKAKEKAEKKAKANAMPVDKIPNKTAFS